MFWRIPRILSFRILSLFVLLGLVFPQILKAAGCWLIKFHQHVTCLYIVNWRAGRPDCVSDVVHPARRTVSKPPAAAVCYRTASCSATVIVAVRRAKHLPVGAPGHALCRLHGIAGVSAVATQSQIVVAGLITDRERGVFSRVPQTGCTLDLLADVPLFQFYVELENQKTNDRVTCTKCRT